jgi:hypothetical protein
MTISFTYSGLPKNVRCPFFVAEVTQKFRTPKSSEPQNPISQTDG